jgi:transposase InsO family protein
MVIDHYSKWCETRPIKSHDEETAAKFLEEKVVCQFGVPKYVFTDNGSEWMKEFDALCQDYGIVHQFISPAWPQCNGMVECLIQTIMHG